MNSPLKISDSTRRTRWGTPNTAGVSIPHELSFDRLCHQIGDIKILRDISLVAKTGSVTCLLGPSGSGKTTLLRIAAGMERQTTGCVLMDGQEICGPSRFVEPERRGIGLVFQDYALFPHLNIIDNVMFGLSHLKRDAKQAQALKMLGRVGLDDRASDFPHNLSGGEQQRVALARALAPRPGVLLMDEPFSGLDSRLRDTMREETLAILRETRATSIIVTHDPEEALRMGEQIALLHHGRLEQVGSGRDLYFKPQTLFTAGFFSELNYFDGIVKNGSVDTPLGRLKAKHLADGTASTSAIRVSSIEVRDAAKTIRGVLGRVLSTQFTGDHDHLRIGISGADQAIRARVKAGSLSSQVLSGSVEVRITPAKEGSFTFPASDVIAG